MEQSKPWYASKTVWGSVIGGAGLVTAYFGTSLDTETQKLLVDQTTGLIIAALALISTVTTLVGRLRAKKPIG